MWLLYLPISSIYFIKFANVTNTGQHNNVHSYIIEQTADAQVGLDPCWSQTHYVGFVVTRLTYYLLCCSELLWLEFELVHFYFKEVHVKNILKLNSWQDTILFDCTNLQADKLADHPRMIHVSKQSYYLVFKMLQ
jgi:hypothetical protein